MLTLSETPGLVFGNNDIKKIQKITSFVNDKKRNKSLPPRPTRRRSEAHQCATAHWLRMAD